MTSKKNQVKKAIVSKKSSVVDGKVMRKISTKNKAMTNINKENLADVVGKKVKVHWEVIQKDFRLLADDMSYCFKDVKEVLSEKGVERIKDFQVKMNSKFIWK